MSLLQQTRTCLEILSEKNLGRKTKGQQEERRQEEMKVLHSEKRQRR